MSKNVQKNRNNCTSFKQLIKNILILFHLLEIAQEIKHFVIKVFCLWGARKKVRTFYRDFSDFSEQIYRKELKPGCVVFTGIILTDHKPTLPIFLQLIQEQLPENQFVLLDESLQEENTSSFYRFILPRSIPLKYDKNLEMPVIKKDKELLASKPFLQEAVINIKSRQKDLNCGYAEALVCNTYRMYGDVIEAWKPSAVIIWNKFSALHTICAKTCEEKNVIPLFFEFGSLPGTFALEDGGQMGESFPATHYKEFRSLFVEEEEMACGERILDYLNKSKLNRNTQPVNDEIETLKHRLKPDRPIVVYTGQNDFDSGLVPYGLHSQEFHSPIFKSSREAVKFLAALAKKNDWNLIFKPHPHLADRYKGKVVPQSVIFVHKIDINELIDLADITVTIMSQTSYVSLIRGKATVLLGYNQLRGKGCIYEAYAKEDVESVIIRALKQGYTLQQKQAFVRHIMQMVKYYLYDDLTDRPERFGRGTDEAAVYLKDHLVQPVVADH